jgi:hypothetical protein
LLRHSGHSRVGAAGGGSGEKTRHEPIDRNDHKVIDHQRNDNERKQSFDEVADKEATMVDGEKSAEKYGTPQTRRSAE